MHRTIVFIALLLCLCGCSLDVRQKYTVVEINQIYLNNPYCKYELLETGWFAKRKRIIDTIGKYKVGDTVTITLKTSNNERY